MNEERIQGKGIKRKEFTTNKEIKRGRK